MEARFERASPLIILIGNPPVLFHTCFPVFLVVGQFQFVLEGHGFSRAVNAAKSTAALGAGGMRSLFIGTLLISGIAAAQQPPDPLNQHYSAAQTFQLGGDFERAEAEYHQVLALALQRMANLSPAENNDSEKAVHLLEEAVVADPSYEGARLDLAQVYFRAGHLDRASAQAAAVVKAEPSNVRALQLLGDIEFAQGNFAAAADHLHTALGLQGDFDTAYSLALAYLSQQKLAETKLLFDEILNDMGSTPQLHVLLGRAYRETGYLDEAIREFKKAIELDPKYPRVHYYLALAYLGQGEKERFPTARPLFERELEINPKEFFSTFFLGVIHLEDRDFPAAEDYLKKAVQLQPDNPDPLLYLGQAYFETNHPELAIGALKKSIELTNDPSRNHYQVSKAHTMIGQILIKMGKQDEAEAELKRSQALREQAFQSDKERQDAHEMGQHELLPDLPNAQEKPALLENRPPRTAAQEKQAQQLRATLAEILANAYNNLGVIQARGEHYAPAADYFRSAAQWKPDLPGLDRNWGLASFRAQRFEEAIGPLERQVASRPDDAKARDALGVSYFTVEKFAKTVQVFQPVLANLPDDPGALYALGVSLVRTGDSATASNVFRSMLERNPKVAEIHVLLGQADADQNQYTPAADEFSRALELDPKIEGAHFGRGLILLHEGKIDDSVGEFRAELEAHPADAKAKYHLAYALLMKQEKDQAFTLLSEVVRDKPDYADAQYQLGKILLERGEVKAAIERLESAVHLDPTKDYNYFQLSAAYRRDGRLEDAQHALQDYQKLKEKERGTEHP
jgi:tetratricopeptide (TPR) repeat protein